MIVVILGMHDMHFFQPIQMTNNCLLPMSAIKKITDHILYFNKKLITCS